MCTNGSDSYAGIGAGGTEDVTVSHTTAVNCNVTTHGDTSVAGIGVGANLRGNVTNTTAKHCTVKTSGKKAYASIGAGANEKAGIINNTIAVDCHVSTKGENAIAGIGVGDNSGNVTNTTAKHCTVKTSGEKAHAGIGAGANRKARTINNTIAVDCDVSTEGFRATAGIGAGRQKGSITNTRAIDSNVTSRYATAGIWGGKNPVICNVNVNHKKISSARGCQSWRDNNFCADIDSSLLTPKCKIVNNGHDNLANSRPTSPIPETVVTQIPFAASLDTTTKIVIALGSVIVVLLGAISVIACCYCRSSTNANRNREPLMPEGNQTRGQRPALPRYQTSEKQETTGWFAPGTLPTLVVQPDIAATCLPKPLPGVSIPTSKHGNR